MAKFYSLDEINKTGAVYRVIIGERSNGKTYAVLKQILTNYANGKGQGAIVRRWQEDFTGKRGATVWQALVTNKEVERATKGKYTDVYYYSSRWYLCYYDEKGNRVLDETPLAYGFAISQAEHDKSTSYPDITTILFDEFISRTGYLPDEFVLFMNVVSTIIRQRRNVVVYMCGNTVNKYCPYFSEMGVKHVKTMKQGTIDLYRYGDSELTVAVEYCKPNSKGKESDFYFAFDNSKLSMISSGAWEIAIYPHITERYKPKDILLTFFIIFSGDTLQCEVVSTESGIFVAIHKKTTPIKHPDTDLVFSTDFDVRPNWVRDITRPTNKVTSSIADLFKKDKVFYQDNETGEILRNYLLWCGKDV